MVRAAAYMATLSLSFLKASVNKLFALAFKEDCERVAMYASARTWSTLPIWTRRARSKLSRWVAATQ
ncbi:hypothetical protein JI435_403400 [Parastagonospora nodorum SN15]|uniref:Uncharacterized protein n=1 Tax=Phaeosphaeria nodorum (strain SN15 / ATCC MYA-4574 / FGSC 10173) TaxID=321614 RepID=A0A7U2HYA5_PHANO|nr:hypothetical protein JI435_403400 [Parastagonospora nodorum SN15]